VVQAVLPAELVDRVLERLGLGPGPSLDALYAAWCQAVPYDSAQKRRYFAEGRTGPLPGSSPVEFFETWLVHGCGGTCWSGSFALHALLTSLGHDARFGAGFVMRPGDPLAELPNHGTVLVRHGDADVIVDSSFLTDRPLPVPPPDDRVIAFRNLRPGSVERWRLLLTDVPGDLAAVWHEATRASSRFNRMLAVRHNRGDEVVGWTWGQAARVRADGTSELLDVDRTTWLVEQIGFSEQLASSLPADELVHAA
jgi:N-hydroxyarylamine O-acetyltransferase